VTTLSQALAHSRNCKAIWAWLILVVFQLLLRMIASAVIMPLLDKFTPLAEGASRERL